MRALEDQEDNLDNLRSRVGVLLSAASVATAFLGGVVFQSHSMGTLGGAAMVLYAVHVALDLWILKPRKWRFQVSPKVLLDSWIDRDHMSINRLRRVLARKMELVWDRNFEMLDQLWALYSWAILVLGLEILAWLLQLAGTEAWVRRLLSA